MVIRICIYAETGMLFGRSNVAAVIISAPQKLTKHKLVNACQFCTVLMRYRSYSVLFVRISTLEDRVKEDLPKFLHICFSDYPRFRASKLKYTLGFTYTLILFSIRLFRSWFKQYIRKMMSPDQIKEGNRYFQRIWWNNSLRTSIRVPTCVSCNHES